MKNIPKTDISDTAVAELVRNWWAQAPAYGWHLEFSVMENLRRNAELRNKRRIDRLQDQTEGPPAR